MITNATDKAKAWAENPYFDDASRKEIQNLIDSNDQKEIEERFYKDLEFGTGGLRSILGQGNNRINKYTVRKATQALAIEILNQNIERPSIAISYDSRNKSFEFAKEVAAVMAANNIKAYIYKRLNPVSLLSYSVRHHKAAAGVMVTASHNPPEYNGYKVFWSDGAQVTPPYDTNIIDHYKNISDFSSIKYDTFENGESKNMIEWVGEEVENKYYEAILSKAINPELCKEHGDKIKIVYTPIHGTGLVPCTKALEDLGLTNYFVVEEQAMPDKNFPTVSSPNPENPEALKMALDLLVEKDADIAFGSDPDTDRLGVVFKHNNEDIYLNGNQIGILMLHYILTNLKEKNLLKENSYFVKTIVTTNLQEKIATSFGVQTENTLTGFKWICGKMNEIEKNDPSRNFLFATEESFGYLNHEYVRDKDGVSSLTLMAEMTLYYKMKGMNLVDALDKIYEEYGFSHESLLCLNYYGKEGAEKITRIMDRFRNYTSTELCGQEIKSISDYKSSKLKQLKNNSIEPIDLPSSNVLGFTLVNGDKVFLRPSGTEPKIKFYIMIAKNEGDLETKKKNALKTTDSILSFVKSESEKA